MRKQRKPKLIGGPVSALLLQLTSKHGDIARLCRISGVNNWSVYRWRMGKTSMRLITAERLLQAACVGGFRIIPID